jgi:hypothetical protein
MCPEPGCSGIVAAEQQSRGAGRQMHQLYSLKPFPFFELILYYSLDGSYERYIAMIFGLLLETYFISEHAV